MSHRVSFSTLVTNKDIAKKALKDNNVDFREEGDRLVLTTGDYSGTTIDTRSGRITGADTDRNRGATEERIGVIRQMYSVAERQDMHFRVGATVTNKYTKQVGSQQVVVLCVSKEA